MALCPLSLSQNCDCPVIAISGNFARRICCLRTHQNYGNVYKIRYSLRNMSHNHIRLETHPIAYLVGTR